MGLDIRLPIGLMFTLIGLLMTVFGLATGGSDLYQRSLDININLVWGLILLVFGGVMLFFSLKDRNAGKK
jgi:hypothetical protein